MESHYAVLTFGNPYGLGNDHRFLCPLVKQIDTKMYDEPFSEFLRYMLNPNPDRLNGGFDQEDRQLVKRVVDDICQNNGKLNQTDLSELLLDPSNNVRFSCKKNDTGENEYVTLFKDDRISSISDFIELHKDGPKELRFYYTLTVFIEYL